MEYNTTLISRHFECGRLGRNLSAASGVLAIGDQTVPNNWTAKALNALRDVQDACFLPLASC
jgi:hypothetical protein